jgi:hypothetical protein
MFEDLDPQSPITPPADAIGAAMRRGRTIRRQRRTAVTAGIAMGTALIGGFALINPLNTDKALQTPIAPVTISPNPLPPGVGADRLDTGTITKLNRTETATTIVYHRYSCDARLDAQALAESDVAVCLNKGSPSSPTDNSEGIDTHTNHKAQLAAGVAIAGSSQLGEFLKKVDPPNLNWFQQPAKNRQVSLNDLYRFLARPDSEGTLFRLHFDTDARIDQIEEVYQP